MVVFQHFLRRRVMENQELVVAEKLDLESIKKVVHGGEALIIPCVKAFADGKVNVADVPFAVELLKGTPQIIEGCSAIKGAIPEFKDLDQSEIIEIAAIGYDLVLKIVAAYKENKK
jgi:hypothetical protein